MQGYINGKAFEAECFGYDNCHKFYLVDSEQGLRDMIRYEYDLYPIEDLPAMWAGSCPLRFIDSADLKRTYVRQCEPAEFKGWQLDSWLEYELEDMRIEQLEANGEL